jgi:ergothioneine biosynthesis glutamate--cysteine ligase EgtA
MAVIDVGGLDEADLDEVSAFGHVHGICLKTGPPRRVGVELEWLVRDMRDPALPVAAGRIAAAVSAFDTAQQNDAQQDAFHGETGTYRDNGGHGAAGRPGIAGRHGAAGRHGGARGHGAAGRHRGGGRHGAAGRHGASHIGADLPTSSCPGVLPSGALLTAEPGGQLEISSQPADSLAELITATCADLTALRSALAEAGLELAGIGLDPLRPPRRVLTLPRYAAMEAFFDRGGPWGRRMMCSTASVQVCLDAGDESDGPSGYRSRWRLLHAVGPVLVAAFANSPLREGRPTGWASSRQQVWAGMDPGRTRAPRIDDDPRAAWAAYALDAQLMCVREPGSANWSAPPGLTFRDWVRADRGRLRPPTVSDLGYHLSTLFPPVRPRGHFELRMIDAQPGDGWTVPLAVCWALLSDAEAGDAARAAVAPLWGGGGEDSAPWLRAARLGPADPVISRASRDCFAVAREALDRMAAPEPIAAAVDAFTERYVSKDRCPADDLLEESP